MKQCTICAKDFEPKYSSMQVVCGLACAKRVPVVQRKADKERLKRRADHLKDTERAFNAYICSRDAHLPCVSCGCVESPGWHASHYRSVGSSPALRFDPANVHRSCVKCNLHLHGNPIPYRVELLRRIGPAELERLEGPQETKKYTVEQLAEIRQWCRQQMKEISK
jgi:Bacteriophage Lambda NinG protein